MGPPLVLLGSGLEQWGRQLLLLGRSFATAASLAFKTVMGTANGAAGRWRASCCPIHAAYMAGMPYALSPPDDEKLLCSCSRLPSSCTIGTWVSVFVAVCCHTTVELLQLLLASHFASYLAAYA